MLIIIEMIVIMILVIKITRIMEYNAKLYEIV